MLRRTAPGNDPDKLRYAFRAKIPVHQQLELSIASRNRGSVPFMHSSDRTRLMPLDQEICLHYSRVIILWTGYADDFHAL